MSTPVSISHPTGLHNFSIVTIGELSLAFSYETVIGFKNTETRWTWRLPDNVWSVTTGKHLNFLNPDKKQRLPYQDWKQELEEALGAYDLEAWRS